MVGEMLEQCMFQRQNKIRHVLLGEGGESGILVRLVFVEGLEEVRDVLQDRPQGVVGGHLKRML